ncbi:MAG TPA: tetratricopeptide repeat protein, partial [Thermoanaerobaculia bacterium]|nr:tetratricopeptide repeat protein [Thermoanaerobaculia bacterium]
PLFRAPQLDSLEYVSWASAIAAGDFRWPSPPPHGPGYPFFLAGVFRLFPGSLPAASVAQALLGASTCVGVAALTGIWFGPLAAWAAGLLLAFHGFAVSTDVSLLAEGLLLLLMTSVLLCLGNAPLSHTRAAGAGALTGLSALVRPTALVLLPIVLVTVARREGWRLRGFRTAGLAAAAAGLVLLPVTVANWRAGCAPLLIQGHGGFNFWIGNSPSGTGLPTVRPGARWDFLEAEAARNGVQSPAGQDRFFFRKTLEEISVSPLAYLRLLGRKFFWTIQADEIRDPFSFSFFEKSSPLLAALPGFGLLFPLSLVGILIPARSRPRPALLLAGVAATAGACVLLVTSSRYRLPFVVALVPFAGAGLVTGIEILRKRSARSAMLIGVLAAGVVLCRLTVHAPSHIHAEEWSATGYALIHLRESDDAEKAFRRSIEEDGRWSPAWAGLGVVAANRGDPAGAEDFFKQALSREPDNLTARQELGTLLESQGRFADAEAVYRRAWEVAPGDAAFGRALARTLLAEGRLSEALTLMRELLARNAEDAAAHLLFARALAAQHRTRPAALEAARAARLDPGNSEAHFTLAMLRIEAGELEAAEESLRRAETLGADPRPLGLARALLCRSHGQFAEADGILRGVLAHDRAYKPAAALLLQNARSRGKEGEALDYLRGLAAHGS